VANRVVGHFIDSGVRGGAEVLLIDLCDQMRGTGFDPVVLHFGHPYLVQACGDLGIPSRVVPGRSHFKATRTLPLFALDLRSFLRRAGLDLLHSHLFGAITGSAAGAFLAGVPHVGTLHDVHVVQERPSRMRLLELAAVLGTRLVAVSEDAERYYRKQGHFPKRRLTSIPNGVDLQAYAPRSGAALREALGIAADTRVVSTAGRLVEVKRLDLLIRAFATAPAAESATLVIAGDGPLRGDLEALVRQLGLEARVLLLGLRDDVADILAMSDLFCLSSDSEGMSRTLLEAMAIGLPAVVTDVGGNRELVADTVSGSLVPPGDPAAFAAALDRLLASAPLREQMGRAARERADGFSLDRMTQRYLLLYEELLR
jgi:glycosyltransferase involved in cell wall biosynthesis